MQGNWPKDLFEQQRALFNSALGPRLESDIRPLQTKVGNTKHPWNMISFATIIVGGLGAIALQKLYDPALVPALIATAIVFFKIRSVARRKNKAVFKAKADLAHYVQDAIGLGIYNVKNTHGAVLKTFSHAGFLGRFDNMHYLAALGPIPTNTQNRAQGSPQNTQDSQMQIIAQSIGTKLTRTEVETYTDSKGQRRTRTRIIKVFEGLMLEMELDGFESDNRTLITSRRHYGFSGSFDRLTNGKRHKMDEIKTSSLEFNSYYDVHTDDQTLGHLFLNPDRIMRFINLYDDLRKITDKKKVKLSMLVTRNKMWVALETDGLPKVDEFSSDTDALDREINGVIGLAALPHILARHLELSNPVPYAWQDYVLEAETTNVTQTRQS